MIKLMYITNDKNVAKIVERAGVERVFVDMEYIGKDLRQGGKDTVQNHHTVEDAKAIKEVLEKAELLVRCNPIHEATDEYCSSKEEIDAVAVTYNPGLVGALLVGVSVAKSLAYALGKPLIPVNHIQGHIAANYIAFKELEPPFVSLVASGGHSHILHIKDYHSFDILGATTDDAAGEAFDKVARVLGLGYPGGPKVNKIAQSGNPEAIRFPRPHNGFDFSFSGLKTAVINYVHTAEQKSEKINAADVAASFQKAVTDVLTTNVVEAAKSVGVNKIALAGGVAANTALRMQMEEESRKNGMEFFCPPFELCTDNGAMISCAGYLSYISGIRGGLDLNAVPQLSLG